MQVKVNQQQQQLHELLLSDSLDYIKPLPYTSGTPMDLSSATFSCCFLGSVVLVSSTPARGNGDCPGPVAGGLLGLGPGLGATAQKHNNYGQQE